MDFDLTSGTPPVRVDCRVVRDWEVYKPHMHFSSISKQKGHESMGRKARCELSMITGLHDRRLLDMTLIRTFMS